MPRYLIVNADDLGLSDGVNRGIIEAVEHGIVTSASLMVRQPAAAAAAAYDWNSAGVSIGLHLDLGEWVLRNDEWVPLYSVVSTDDARSVKRETERQLSEFRRLLGRDPTHLDSHQHVHRQEPVRSLLVDLGAELCIPVRDCTAGVTYCGDFYGQGAAGEPLHELLTVENLSQILASLPERLTELGCHPGYGKGLATPYCDERALEVAALCAPEIRRELERYAIELRSFEQIPARISVH